MRQPRSSAGARRRGEEDRPAAPRRRPATGEALRIPHDPVNEIVLLAAVLVDPDAAARYLPVIPAESFFGTGHAEAWALLQEIRRRGLSYDPATVQQLSGGTVDPALLEEYARERPKPPPNLRHHADCIAWDRARVEVVRGPVQAFLEALRDPTTDPMRTRALARSIGEALDGFGDRRFLRDPSAVVRDHRRELTERRMGVSVYPFGWEGFDFYGDGDSEPGAARIIPGAAPEMVTVMAGVSGSGKTTVSARLALAQSRMGRRVLYGAWEQNAGMTLEVIAGMSLGFSRTALMTGKFSEQDQQELEAEMELLGERIRFLDLPFGRGTGERRTNAANLDALHQYVSDAAPDVFIADLFKRALTETTPDEEEQALYRIQAIAQETQTHVVLVQQLRLKDVESRADQRPTRDAVKGSSAWVDVADTLIGWYRPALHKSVPDDLIQALVLKQRYGRWPLAVEFDWEPEFGWLGRGRSIEYDRPGEQGEDGFLGSSVLGRRAGAARKASR